MAAGDLTTLAAVKAWRNPPIASPADDAQLGREITSASKAILQYIQRRSLAPMTYTETRNGAGTAGLLLRNYPVISVTSVKVNNQTIPQATNANSSGWVYSSDDGMLYLRGFCFVRGAQNVEVVYSAGLVAEDEQQIVGSDNKLQCSALAQLWASNIRVRYADDLSLLIPVAANPSPAQYVPPATPDGFYLFSGEDKDVAVLVDYGYTPRDVEEACITLVILEYNRRGQIGQNSKVLAGENVTYYSQSAFTPTVKSRLQSYMNVVPNP